MAKQAGIIRLIGTVGNITFLKTPDGFIARDKAVVNAERFLTNPNYARTRENNAEFGNAATSGKLLRESVNDLVHVAKDRKLIPRLTKDMLKVVKSDTVSLRGQRTVATGNSALLQGFNFNGNAELTTVLSVPYTTAIDRVAGTLKATIPAFNPLNSLIAPQGATHFMIVSAGAEMDFAGNGYVSAYSSSDAIPYSGTATTEIDLSNAVTAASTSPLFLVLGVQFFQQVNGVNYSLQNGEFNPLAVVAVSVA